ncbi:sensor histidine kinase [Haloarcula marina]|uniref:sensor histidine kinase n=1 Tax=Haloarcula marina TaxID=2961574 RepID=UPI0020B6CE30|nr:hybrid sensor histidine kinase/response regulator [Halomicroarcula marina]
MSPGEQTVRVASYGLDNASVSDIHPALAEHDGVDVTAVADPASVTGDAFDAFLVADDPPDTDALDAFQRVRAADATLPVLAVGEGNDGDRIEAMLAAGLSEYVAWRDPDSAPELAAKLRTSVRLPWVDGAAMTGRWEAVIRSLAHDAKNPLNVVSGRLELVDIDETHADAMTRSVRRVDSLLGELSTVVQVMGPVDESEPVALDDVVREVWAKVATTDSTLAVEAEQTIATDPEALRTILTRLLENAVAHGGETVTVTDTDGGFAVADDGPGIPEEDWEAVFEQGYGTTREGEGYGLFVAEWTATALGWDIELGDSESGGTRVDVTVR